eukprot:11522785-Alexandrium_andersonii.AAC.1
MYSTLHAMQHCTLLTSTSARAQLTHRNTLRTGLRALANTARKMPRRRITNRSAVPASRAALACA